jgi:hypothetical protein
MVIHHVPDLDACARELCRFLKPDGLVFIRNTFGGRLEGIPHYEFFPSARAIDEAPRPLVLRADHRRRVRTKPRANATRGRA